MDEELKQMSNSKQISETEGSTATICLLYDDKIYISYVGDSSAILMRDQGKTIIPLCPVLDNADQNPEEVKRIEDAGGVVLKVGRTQRVQGELAVTRTLGGAKYKPYVISEPHVNEFEIKDVEQNTEEYIIIGSDGLWKTLNNEELSQLVYGNKGLQESEIAEKIYEAAIDKNCMDNITIAVINLQKRRKLMNGIGFPAPPTSRDTTEHRKCFSFPINLH